MSAQINLINPIVAGTLLIAAGLYQWTPLKNACLKNCRGPIHLLTQRWRRSPLGALPMGKGIGQISGSLSVVAGLLLMIAA
jgi:predicted metal-binding membrane protein